MEISAPSAQRQQIAEIEKQTKEQSQVNIILEFYLTFLGKGSQIFSFLYFCNLIVWN